MISDGRYEKKVNFFEHIRQDTMRDHERAARFAEGKQIEAPVVEELNIAGLPVEIVSDLYNLRLNYSAAIPILLKWLPAVTDNTLKEEIVRALSVKWAKPAAAPLLVEEFPKATGHHSLQWAIGSALEVVADDSVFEGIARLAIDRKYGKAREMVVAALGNMKHPEAVEVLIELLDDNEVAGHALWALRKLGKRAKKARPHIERFLGHPRTWWRNEAKRAIAKIDKA